MFMSACTAEDFAVSSLKTDAGAWQQYLTAESVMDTCFG